MRALAGLFLN